MRKIKENKGITLIALIITIIVLLILAGVVINMTLGNDGIIAKAQSATNAYQNAQEKEEIELAKVEEIINNRDMVMVDKEEYEQMKARINSLSNYSTGEQIVGTWINGKTIYEITFDLGEEKTIEPNDTIFSTGGTWFDTGIPCGSIETIISCSCVNEGGTPSTITTLTKSFGGNGNIGINNGSIRKITVRYITLQYTKTT